MQIEVEMSEMNPEKRMYPLSSSRFPNGRNVVWMASVAMVYFAAARLSLSLVFQPEGIAAVWPPEGIFLSAILLTRRGLRLYLVIALCVADFVAERQAGTPLFVSALYALTLTGDAVLSSWLLLHFVGERITFTRVREVFGLLALSVILSNGLLSMAAAAASRLLPGTSSFWNAWKWWAASGGMGNLLVTPFILSWASRASRALGPWSWSRATEGAALFLSLTLLNFLVFTHLSESPLFSLLLAYVTLPFLLWAALRFGVCGVTSALIVLAVIAVSYAAVSPLSGFPFRASPLDAVLGVQLYLALLAVPSLFLGAVVAEHKEMREALRASEERFKIVATNTPDHIVVQDADLRYVWVINSQLGLTEADMIGKTDFDLLDAAEAEKLTQIKRGVLASGRPVHLELPLHCHGKTEYFDGSYVPVPSPGGRADRLVGYFRNVTERRRMEEALRESEARLNKAQEMAHLGSWELDPTTGRLVWSEEVYRIFGISPQDFGGTYQAFLDLVHPDDRAAVAAAYSRSLREDRDAYEIEHRVVRKSTGEIRHVHERCEHIRDASHRVIRSLGMVHDVTERQQAEESLRFTQFAIDHAADAAFWIAEDAHFFYVNEAACQALGYSCEQLLRMSVFDIDPVFTKNDWLRSWERLKVRKSATFETVHQASNGRSYPVEIHASYLEFGGRAYHCAFARNVSERKRAEQALLRLTRKDEEALRVARMAHWEFDIPTGVFTFNDQYYTLHGTTAQEAGGYRMSAEAFARRYVHPEDAHLLQENIQRAAASTEPDFQIQAEARIRRMDGEVRWVAVWFRLERDASGQAMKLHGVNQDITERRQAEEALRDLNTKLESKVAQRTAQLQRRAAQLQKLTLDLSQAEERERRRIALILHEDLQQQIAGAKFQMGIVKGRTRHDPVLHATVTRIDQMLKEAIDKSRNLSTDLSPAVLHMNNLAEVLRCLANQTHERHGLTVRVHVSETVTLQSESLVMFLFRAAQELLFNVVKHAHVNEADIYGRRIGTCVCLCVSDRGRGFDPNRIRETIGFGLLSIRERVELLGGRMKIRSAEGKGSQFRIVVPDKNES
jgi:PAS domain S-box-containing protein